MITKETEDKYLASGGAFCPKCKKHHIEGGEINIEGGYAFQGVWCNHCGYSWTDEYKLLAAYDEEDGLEKDEIKNFY